jgi:hypothetical protein
MKMRFRYEIELQKLHTIYDNIRTIEINVKKILFIGPISKNDQVLIERNTNIAILQISKEYHKNIQN